MIEKPTISSPTIEALPSTTTRSADVNLAWKKLLLDLCSEHLRDGLATTKRHSLQIPDSGHVHLLDTDQLWQSLELQNKSILPATKRRLRRLVPSRKQPAPSGPGIPHVDGDQEDRDIANTDNDSGEDSSSSADPSDTNADHQVPDTAGSGPEAGGSVAGDVLGSPKDLDDAESDDDEPQLNKKLLKERHMIEALEEENIAAKPWSLRGEVVASSRPKNSLLGSTFEFDTVAKPNILAAGDLNASIEDMIKRRIADGSFDDVLPQALPKPIKPESVGDTLVDSLSEKPSKGLGELYEEEYRESDRKKQELLNQQGTTLSRRDKEVAEIYADFESLMQKLDALSRTSATPVINDIARTTAEAVPEDLVKEDAIVSAPDAEQGKSRGGRDGSHGGASRPQRKRKRRKR